MQFGEYVLVLIVTTLQLSTLAHGDNGNLGKETDEQRLLNRLMMNYDSRTRPVMNASSPVKIKMGITLNQIFDVDERNQVLTTHIWLDQEWLDEKLYWDPADYNGLTTLRVPPDLIWKPDIVLYNSADDYTNGYMPALAMISFNGHVFWPPIVKFESTCKIDITYFPFDDQTCSLKLGSWAYDGFQVDVLKRDNPIDLSNYVSNGEWELINVKIVRNVEQYSCCPEPYPDVTFTLHIRRRTLYYTYNVIIPCLMLSSLTLLGFWMPPETGEKVALGLTILLAFSVFMLLIAENMPATSFYIPLIGIYIIVAMGLTSVSVCFAVAVSYTHHQGNMGKDIPGWLRKVGHFLNRFVAVHKHCQWAKNGGKQRPDCLNKSPSTTETTPDLKTPLKESFSSINFTFKNDCDVADFENGNAIANAEFTREREREYAKEQRRSRRRHNEALSKAEEIMKKLDIILSKQEELLKVKDSATSREWHEIAEVIDRALFWFYLVATFISTVIILLLIPLGKTVKL